jgi:hypothetical protein
VIWLQIVVGALLSGAVFLRVSARPTRSRAVSMSIVVVFAVAITVAIALQAGHKDRGTIADVAKVFVLALALSTEGLFVARWLASKPLPSWAKLLLYVPIIAAAGALTMAIVAGIAAGS